MPVWAWIAVVIGGLLGFGKAYDWNSKRHGHRPGTGEERPVDLTHYHPLPPPDGSGGMGGIGSGQ